MKTRLLSICALTLVVLAACQDEPATPGDDQREASGEVLEGTISDAMLPIEQVRSQPPLVVDEPAPLEADAAPEDAPAEEATSTEEPDTAAEPVATEEPQPAE